jgi:tetratricopeptide (TPR) repeat protein
MRSRWIEDLGERLRFYHAALWAFIACTAFAIMVAYYLMATRHIGWLIAVGILLLGWLLAATITLAVWTASGVVGRALVQYMTAAGNLPPAPSFSLQESLIARGKFSEAVREFEQHLEAKPNDLHARLALAGLWRDQLHDPVMAERLLLDTRRLDPPAPIEFAIGNALIDLYRAGGQPGREMAELARFAEKFAGSEAGARARAALLRLKARES